RAGPGGGRPRGRACAQALRDACRLRRRPGHDLPPLAAGRLTGGTRRDPARAGALRAHAASLRLSRLPGRLVADRLVARVGVLGQRVALTLVQRLVQVCQVLVGVTLGALLMHVAQMLDQVGLGTVLIGDLRGHCSPLFCPAPREAWFPPLLLVNPRGRAPCPESPELRRFGMTRGAPYTDA